MNRLELALKEIIEVRELECPLSQFSTDPILNIAYKALTPPPSVREIPDYRGRDINEESP